MHICTPISALNCAHVLLYVHTHHSCIIRWSAVLSTTISTPLIQISFIVMNEDCTEHHQQCASPRLELHDPYAIGTQWRMWWALFGENTLMAKLKPTYAFLKRLEFLSSGRLYLKNNVKIITLSYDTGKPGSAGIRWFVAVTIPYVPCCICEWHSNLVVCRKFISEKLPPIQYKNPNVQVVLFKNKHPYPAIWIYFEDGRKVMLGVEGKPPERIVSELSAVAAKTE